MGTNIGLIGLAKGIGAIFFKNEIKKCPYLCALCCPDGGMVDTRDLKSLELTLVQVRVLFRAQTNKKANLLNVGWLFLCPRRAQKKSGFQEFSLENRGAAYSSPGYKQIARRNKDRPLDRYILPLLPDDLGKSGFDLKPTVA